MTALARRLPDPDTLPDQLRARLTAASRPLLKGSRVLYLYDGEMHWGVHRAVIKAYLLARMFSFDAHEAAARAFYGTTDLGDAGHRHVRAMVWRLSQLERGPA